jgi:acyl-CoA synthetase (AMP-forming)/AMP-acid ligase II
MSGEIYASPYPAFNVPTNSSISQFLLKYNPENTDADKKIFEDFDAPHKSITYGGIRTAAAQGAAGLRSVLGLREGDVVAIFATNSLDWAVLAHSVMWAGATFW